MKNNGIFRKSLLCIGILLIAVSSAILTVSLVKLGKVDVDCEKTVSFIESVIPEASVGIKEERSNSDMPSVSFEGEDFCALISVPRFSVILPVRSSWDKTAVKKVPCRFTGNPYEGTLVIGGTDSKGQFDFVTKTDIGDVITVTDMKGLVFTYTVYNVKHAKNSKAETLADENSDFTLFARDSRSGDWLLVRCRAAN